MLLRNISPNFLQKFVETRTLPKTVCANKITQLAGNISGGATQGVWTSDGTGSFSPDEYALDAIYEPSLADLSGWFSYTYIDLH